MADDLKKKRISELDNVGNDQSTGLPIVADGDLFEVAEPQENGTFYASKNISIEQIKEYIFAVAYPIGSIYMSLDGTNPQYLFGGQWELFAQGQTIFGVAAKDTSQKDAYSDRFGGAGLTGGNYTVTLNTNNMPQHTHQVDSLSTLLDMGAVEFGIRHSLAQESGKTDPSVKIDPSIGTVTSPSTDIPGTWATGTYIKDQPSSSNQNGDKVSIKMPGMKTEVALGNAGKQNPDPIEVLPPYVTCYIWKKIGDTIQL